MKIVNNLLRLCVFNTTDLTGRSSQIAVRASNIFLGRKEEARSCFLDLNF